MSQFNCPQCQGRSGNGQCVCNAGMVQGQAMAAANQRAGLAAQANQQAAQSASALNAAAMIDQTKAREMMQSLQGVSSPATAAPTSGKAEARLRSLAREAIRCAVQSIALTRRDDGNRVDTQVLKRALEAYAEFQSACDPLTLLTVLDGEDE
jgi:hypothetical protein